MNVLLVEDDPQLVQSLTRGLSENGAAVSHASRVDAARTLIQANTFDLVLLDLGLPGDDGLTLLQSLRAEHSSLPVIILTARGALEDRVEGLRQGADDYLAKPFAFTELLARMEAVLRRSVRVDPEVSAGEVRVNRLTRCVSVGEKQLELTQREADILAYLMTHLARNVSKDELSDQVWKVRARATPMDNVIDVTLSRLRRKLKEAFGRPYMETVRGVGYRYQP